MSRPQAPGAPLWPPGFLASLQGPVVLSLTVDPSVGAACLQRLAVLLDSVGGDCVKTIRGRRMPQARRDVDR